MNEGTRDENIPTDAGMAITASSVLFIVCKDLILQGV
jgi:hypothetical protein